MTLAEKGKSVRKLVIRILMVAGGFALAGCQSAAEHATDVHQAQAAGDKMTVGQVQREIHVGMTSADVASVLGSPNMVTTDEKRRENWVYDKVSTETAYSTSSGGAGILILGAASRAGVASTTQRTLTVIIKFDENSHVRDFAYRSSSF
jgi:outer membrane protein assembly factor BamE (lipoprotein component of BamABCDE complex)